MKPNEHEKTSPGRPPVVDRWTGPIDHCRETAARQGIAPERYVEAAVRLAVLRDC
jgi:hypothetical protein